MKLHGLTDNGFDRLVKGTWLGVDNIPRARKVLVDGATISSVAASGNISKQGLHKIVEKLRAEFEKAPISESWVSLDARIPYLIGVELETLLGMVGDDPASEDVVFIAKQINGVLKRLETRRTGGEASE